MVIIVLVLGYIAYAMTPETRKRLARNWLKGAWIDIKKTSIKAGDWIGDEAGDFAQWIGDDVAPALYEAFARFIRFAAAFLFFDWLIFLVLVAVNIHEAIIAWCMINAVLGFVFLKFSQAGHYVRTVLSKSEKLARNFTRTIALVFWTFSVLAVAEFAVPGILRYQNWITTILFSVLIIGEAWSVYAAKPSGNAGGKLLIIYLVFFVIIGLFNRVITHNALDQWMLSHEYSKTNYDLVTPVVAEKELYVFKLQKSGRRWNQKCELVPATKNGRPWIVLIGDTLQVPVNRDDFRKHGLPYTDCGRNRTISFVEKAGNGLIGIDKHYVLMSGTRLIGKQGNQTTGLTMIAPDSVVKVGANPIFTANELHLTDAKVSVIHYKLSGRLQQALKNGNVVWMQTDVNPHPSALNRIGSTGEGEETLDLSACGSLSFKTANALTLGAHLERTSNILLIEIEELRGQAEITSYLARKKA